MEQYYLAIDIGASSGRHILGHMEDGKMVLEEMYRFPNGMTEENGQRCWNVKALFRAILEGMKKCKEAGKIPVSMGIDTWAVDFVLLDKKNKMLGDAVGYRDSRTAGMDEKVYEIIPEEKLYERTGIQKQIFNTIYQDIRKVLTQLVNGFYSPNDSELFRDLYNSLLNTHSTQYADTYFILADFRSYAEAQKKIMEYYKNKSAWAKSAILNTAHSGKFSSDRTIQEYVDDIWHLPKVKVDVE